MTQQVKPADYQAKPGKHTNLRKWPTAVKDLYKSKPDYLRQLKDNTAELQKLQDVLYAQSRHAILIIFQAMDAAGKDGAIKHVMSGINPQGCQVYSFKQPSTEELAHDFLWRTNKCLPARGRIGIFNRSYYEEVLIVRVHPKLLQHQNLPAATQDMDDIWKHRYESIVHLEHHLHRNGTRIVKFFLHISSAEQQHRLLARVNDATKNWKISAADIQERALWDKYQQAYEQCIRATSTAHAPWHIVPADDKKNARLIISNIITNTLRELDMEYPAPPAHDTLRQIRQALTK